MKKPDALLARLRALGGMDLLEESPTLAGDSRFLREFFLPARGRYRRREFLALAERVQGKDAAAFAVRGRVFRILGEAEEAAKQFERALRLDARCSQALAFQAEMRLVREPQAAAAGLAAALELEPGNAQYLVWKAYALFLAQDQPAALKTLDAALAPGKGSVTGRVLRGILRERDEDLDEAHDDFSAAVKSAPHCAGLYTLRGTVRYKLGDVRDAAEDAHQGLLLHPENLDTFVRILYLSVGKKTAADPAAEREVLLGAADGILKGDPKCAWALAARAGVLGNSLLQLEPLRRAVALEPRRAWMRAFLGRALSGDKELKEGLEEMTAAVRLAPKSGWIRSWRAEVFKKLERPLDAIRDLDAGIKLDPDYRLAYAWRSMLRETRGQARGAVEDMTVCLEVLDRPTFRHRRAVLEWSIEADSVMPLEDLTRCVSRGTFYAFSYGGLLEGFPDRPKDRPHFLKLTIDRLARIARRHPEAALAHAWLGRALLDKGDIAGACASLTTAAELDGGCFLAFAWRGEALCRQRKFERSLSDLDRAVTLSGLFIPSYLWRAVARFSLGRREEASADILRATRCELKDSDMIRAWARWALPRFGETPKEVAGP
jgi:tetratricopeptide (TPR) repeat protein